MEMNWNNRAGDRATVNTRAALQMALLSDAGTHPFSSPCHYGKVTYHLARTGDYLDRVMGHLTCNCGKLLLRVTGLIDGTDLAYSRPSA